MAPQLSQIGASVWNRPCSACIAAKWLYRWAKSGDETLTATLASLCSTAIGNANRAIGTLA